MFDRDVEKRFSDFCQRGSASNRGARNTLAPFRHAPRPREFLRRRDDDECSGTDEGFAFSERNAAGSINVTRFSRYAVALITLIYRASKGVSRVTGAISASESYGCPKCLGGSYTLVTAASHPTF